MTQTNVVFPPMGMIQGPANRSAKPMLFFQFYIPVDESVLVLMVVEQSSFFYPIFYAFFICF